jgi:hypothetical protein
MKDFVFVMNNQTIEEIERRILLNKEKFLFLNKYVMASFMSAGFFVCDW